MYCYEDGIREQIYAGTYDGSLDTCHYDAIYDGCNSLSQGWVERWNNGAPDDNSPWPICKSCYDKRFNSKIHPFVAWAPKAIITGGVR